MEKVNCVLKEDKLVVKPGRELDHHNAMLIKNEVDKFIMNGQVKEVEFNFKNTVFMDSSGIGVIMGRYKLLKSIGGSIYVTNMDKNIERIFSISGLFKIIERR